MPVNTCVPVCTWLPMSVLVQIYARVCERVWTV